MHEISGPDGPLYPGEPSDDDFMKEIDAEHRHFADRLSGLSPDAQAMALKARAARPSNPFEAEMASQYLTVRDHEKRIRALAAEAENVDSIMRLAEIRAEAEGLKEKVAELTGEYGRQQLAKARRESVPDRRRAWRAAYEESAAQSLAERQALDSRIRERAAVIGLRARGKRSDPASSAQ